MIYTQQHYTRRLVFLSLDLITSADLAACQLLLCSGTPVAQWVRTLEDSGLFWGFLFAQDEITCHREVGT